MKELRDRLAKFNTWSEAFHFYFSRVLVYALAFAAPAMIMGGVDSSLPYMIWLLIWIYVLVVFLFGPKRPHA